MPPEPTPVEPDRPPSSYALADVALVVVAALALLRAAGYWPFVVAGAWEVALAVVIFLAAFGVVVMLGWIPGVAANLQERERREQYVGWMVLRWSGLLAIVALLAIGTRTEGAKGGGEDLSPVLRQLKEEVRQDGVAARSIILDSQKKLSELRKRDSEKEAEERKNKAAAPMPLKPIPDPPPAKKP